MGEESEPVAKPDRRFRLVRHPIGAKVRRYVKGRAVEDKTSVLGSDKQPLRHDSESLRRLVSWRQSWQCFRGRAWTQRCLSSRLNANRTVSHSQSASAGHPSKETHQQRLLVATSRACLCLCYQMTAVRLISGRPGDTEGSVQGVFL